MDIGRANKRITFCRYEEAENELKQLRQRLKAVATVWASVEPKSSRERLEANKERPELTYVVTVRYRKGITSDMYIQYDGKLLEIKAPPRNIRESNEMLEIICVEKMDERREVKQEQ